MVVHVLFSNYFDFAENLVTIEDIYADKTEAELAKLALDEANTNPEQQSWNIVTWGVK